MVVMSKKRFFLLMLSFFIQSFASRGENGKLEQIQLFDFNFAHNGSVENLRNVTFETERLFLIPQAPKDHPELAELLLDYEVTKYLNVRDTKYETKEEALDALQKWGDKNNWVIKLKDGTYVGSLGFNIFPYFQFYSACNSIDLSGYKVVDIGYFIGKRFWKHGFAKEACTFLSLKFFQCFDVKVLSVNIHEENTNSIKLAKVVLEFVEKNCDMKVKRGESKFFIEDGREKYPTVCLWVEKVDEGKIG